LRRGLKGSLVDGELGGTRNKSQTHQNYKYLMASVFSKRD
jgi:hypothetical protein